MERAKKSKLCRLLTNLGCVEHFRFWPMTDSASDLSRRSKGPRCEICSIRQSQSLGTGLLCNDLTHPTEMMGRKRSTCVDIPRRLIDTRCHTAMHVPTTQAQLVERSLDWDLVRTRLDQFAAIARVFPIDVLRAAAKSEPYYCHPIAWRLGTWRTDSLLTRIDQLLQVGEALPNWKKEKALIRGRDFADFWSLLWQLQVAEYLQERLCSPSWMGAGPDFEVTTNAGRAYVECYVYRKSFGVEAFLDELVRASCSDAYLLRDHCLPFQIPVENMAQMISSFLAPLLDTESMKTKRLEAEQSYPVMVSSLEGTSLRLVLGNADTSSYAPATGATLTGNPDSYLSVALRETVRAKSDSNGLQSHRPNLLLANFLLSTDAQIAIHRARSLLRPFPSVELPDSIDAAAISTAGIDERLTNAELNLIASSGLHRAIRELMQ